MEKAYNQDAGYIRDLPASEGRPPFLVVCDVGHVLVLRQIHDDLDAAVFRVYGWDDLGERFASTAPGTPELEEAEAELLVRLVALNHERAEEEKRGLVRWLRPNYQAPDDHGVPAERQTEIELEDRIRSPHTTRHAGLTALVPRLPLRGALRASVSLCSAAPRGSHQSWIPRTTRRL